MKEKVRVTPTIEKYRYDIMRCYNLTPKQVYDNYIDSLIYDDEILNEMKLLQEKKEFYQEIKENADAEIKKIDDRLNEINIANQEIKNEQEKRITQANREALALLENAWKAYNNKDKYFKQIKQIDYNQIEAIADRYDVPVKRILGREPYVDFYKVTLKDYKKHISPTLLQEK